MPAGSGVRIEDKFLNTRKVFLSLLIDSCSGILVSYYEIDAIDKSFFFLLLGFVIFYNTIFDGHF